MALTSWVPGADGSGFPAEHLPYGVFSEAAAAGGPGGLPRVGVRVGDAVVDLARLAHAGLVDGPFDQPTLNRFMGEGPERWREVRARLTELVCDPAARPGVEPALVPLDRVALHLPFAVADYVDFYSSIEHATNLGRLFRPDAEPLLPNWRHLPVAYHGRAGTVVVSGTPVRRPQGQRRSDDGTVVFGPTTRLDIELEVGFVIGLPSTPGEPVPVGAAAEHVFGVVLVNDWSARDIQAWEYQPLGPFLGKSFATSIGAWVTPLDALAACRVAGPPQDPPPLPYLALPAEPWALDLALAVELRPAEAGNDPAAGVDAGGASVGGGAGGGEGQGGDRGQGAGDGVGEGEVRGQGVGAGAGVSCGEVRGEGEVISRTSFAGLYWRFPQQIAHLTVNGAHLRTGDLLASGTVSGPERGSEGSLVEQTRGGREPLTVAGVERTFLEDGDEVILRGAATVADDVTLTLADVRGRVVPPDGRRAI